MVAKIRLELDDATGPGFKSIEAGASKAENALDGASNAMNQTQAAAVLLASGLSQSEVAAMSMSDRIEMAEAAMQAAHDAAAHFTDNLIDVERELNAVAEAEYRAAAAAGDAAHGIDRTGDEAQQTADQLKRMDAALENTGNSGGRFVETMAKLWALKETFTKIAQGANYLAEQGNPAFVELREKAQELLAKLIELTELEEIQTFIKTVADGFGAAAEFISDNAQVLDDLIKGYKDLVEVVVSYLEYTGLVAEGTTEELRRMKELEEEESKRYAQKLEQEKAAIQAAKQTEEANKAIRELEKTRAAEAEKEAASKINSIDELKKAQETEIAAMKAKAAAAKLTDEERENSMRKINALEARQREIETKAEAAKTEAAKKELDKKEEATKKAAEKATEDNKKHLELVAADREKANEAGIAAAVEHQRKLREALEKGAAGGGPQVDLESLGGGVASANRVKKYYVDKRVEAADDEIESKYKKSGVMTEDGKYINEETRRQVEAERRAAKENARKQATKEIKSGKADDELYQIQSDFVGSYIEQQGQQQGLAKSSVQAMKQAVQAAVKNKQDTEQLRLQVEEMQNFLAQNMQDRTRRQRASY